MSTYPGSELVLFQHARNWKTYLGRLIRPWVSGSVLEVGAGRMSERDVARLFVERDERVARLTVPPSGLFLESVGYPGEPDPPAPHPLRPAF